MLRGRSYVTPLDVKTVAPGCLGHRLVVDSSEPLDEQAASRIDAGVVAVREVLELVPVPRP